MRLVLALLVSAATLVVPTTADAHLSATPSFLPAGGKARLQLTVHNDLTEVMTGFALTVPEDFRILGTGGEAGWNETVEGATATWSGGSLAPNRPATFEVDVEASTASPGSVELQGDQLYPGNRSVRWPVSLTVVPESGAPGESAYLDGRGIVVLSVLGVLVVATFGFALWRMRRRSLQET